MSSTQELLATLAIEAPAFHADGRQRWDVSPGTLRMIEDLVSPGDSTLEVGVGITTVLFAALGTDHQAISPAPAEFSAVTKWCAAHGIDTSQVGFINGFSDAVLPGLTREVDCALIDGAHSFPMPIIDFHYISHLLKVGGVLIIDDLPIPSVRVVYDFLAGESNWSQIALTDHRAAAFRLTAPLPADDPWGEQPMNHSYPDFSFLPGAERTVVEAGSRLAHSPLVHRVRTRIPAIERLVPAAKRLLR